MQADVVVNCQKKGSFKMTIYNYFILLLLVLILNFLNV